MASPEEQVKTTASPQPLQATEAARKRSEANLGAGLWKSVGMWAWVLFRISGIILVAYLFIHIVVVSQGAISGPEGMLDRLLETFDHPVMVFLDFMLVTAVLYHALNGLRVILMDLGIGVNRHKVVFYAAMVVTGGLMAWFAVVAAPFIF